MGFYFTKDGGGNQKNRERLQTAIGGRLEENRYRNRLRLPLLLHQHLCSTLHHERGVVHPGTWGLWYYLISISLQVLDYSVPNELPYMIMDTDVTPLTILV
jgi:hypothetical protein